MFHWNIYKKRKYKILFKLDNSTKRPVESPMALKYHAFFGINQVQNEGDKW